MLPHKGKGWPPAPTTPSPTQWTAQTLAEVFEAFPGGNNKVLNMLLIPL
jgi:hypothetical protein